MSLTEVSIRGRQRVAWVTLLGSFVVCAFLTITTPLLINRFIQKATKPLTLEVLANQGTLRVSEDGQGMRALIAGNLPQPAKIGSALFTDDTDTALLTLFTPEKTNHLGSVQIYNNSNISIEQADTPRFAGSDLDHAVGFWINDGRLRFNVLPFQNRRLTINIVSAFGSMAITEPGQYSIEVDNSSMQMAVLQGAALVSGDGESLKLQADQRAVINLNKVLAGPLESERNLVKNGRFEAEFDEWTVFDWNVELADQPTGETIIEKREDVSTVIMRRVGTGHADEVMRQIIEQDVTDFTSLKLSINLRINQQTLAVCGGEGSECPLAIRLEYEDIEGESREWVQGFYSSGNVTNELIDVCRRCQPPLNPHVLFTPGQMKFYESPNLLEQMRAEDIKVSRIKNLSLVAAGHGFDVEVIDVALLARE